MFGHPIAIVLSSIVLLIGPRVWVERIMKHHNREEEDALPSGSELARAMLNEHEIWDVTVEATDLGDHYDPETKSVRLTHDKIDRRSLTAVVTAAHEVSHAVQDAEGYVPFVWRRRLGKISRVTGEIGAVILLSAPIAALVTRTPLPPRFIAYTAMAILGTGGVAQIAALPAEWDASFRRALPSLEDRYLGVEELRDAKRMLFACSLTYVGAVLAALVHVYPWLPRRPVPFFGLSIDTTPSTPAGAVSGEREYGSAANLEELGLGKVMLEVAGETLGGGWRRLARAASRIT